MLSAKAGELEALEAAEFIEQGKFSGSIRLTKRDGGSMWAPGAALVFAPERNGDNSAQFFIFQNLPSDDFLTAGYRVFKDATMVKQYFYKQRYPLDEAVNIAVEVKNGHFVFVIGSAEKKSIVTSLNKVKPRIEVNSGEAEFSGFDNIILPN